jgi:hypothetical protein
VYDAGLELTQQPVNPPINPKVLAFAAMQFVYGDIACHPLPEGSRILETDNGVPVTVMRRPIDQIHQTIFQTAYT